MNSSISGVDPQKIKGVEPHTKMDVPGVELHTEQGVPGVEPQTEQDIPGVEPHTEQEVPSVELHTEQEAPDVEPPTEQEIPVRGLKSAKAKSKVVKRKRYYGKPYNVNQNMFYEQYMDSVARGDKI